LFQRWIPESDLVTFRETGFYSTQVRPGLRAVAVNSNMCNTANPWLSYAWRDPLNQLQQLADALADAEAVGDKVLNNKWKSAHFYYLTAQLVADSDQDELR